MHRLVVADDHPIVHHAIRAALPNPRFAVVAECTDGATALRAARALRADLLVLDLSLPDMSGISVLHAIRAEHLPLRVLVVSAHGEEDGGVRAMRAGADGYVPKSASPDELRHALGIVARGKRYFRAAVAEASSRTVDDDALLASLSGREFGVLKGLAQGHGNREIAAGLGISPKSVSACRGKLMRKLGARHLRALIDFARNNNIVDP
jgi:two-component system response regulator EvgA